MTSLSGGGGSGGSIRIEGDNVTLNTVSAVGGANYAAGGNGRVAIYYQSSLTMTASNPMAYSPQQPAPTPTAIDLTPAPIIQGTGADGDLTVLENSTFNINTQYSGTRTCADAVAYSVIQLTAGSAKLSTGPSLNCLTVGDEVLLINLKGTSTNYANVGNYEFLRVGTVVGDTVYFNASKTKYYGANATDDTNIGTDSTKQRVMLIRVPNYEDVTVDGTLTASTWDGTNPGVVIFRVKGRLSGSGTIDVSGKGYAGGAAAALGDYPGLPGGGIGPARTGGGNGGVLNGSYIGAGAGYGTVGTGTNGYGYAYGAPPLNQIYLGSGGGSGRSNMNGQTGQGSVGGVGGRGGGAILITAETIDFDGAISANGADGGYVTSLSGGGGSGGSIRLEGDNVTLNTVSAVGGANYAAGGNGRVAIYYNSSLTNSGTICSQSTVYCQNINNIPVAAGTPVGVGIYDDSTSAWTYSGTWNTYSGSGPYSSSLHQSNAAGSYAELTFEGTHISLTYLKAAGRGSIDVYIDGAKVDTLNAYNPTTVYQPTWTSQSVSAGVHTARFVNAGGGWIDLDAIQVYSDSTPTATPSPTPAPLDWYPSNYTYSTDIPHAVTSVNRGVTPADSFTYDLNGNMTCRVESGVTYKQTYNAENRIASIQKLASGTCAEPGTLDAIWNYTYDGDGTRTGQSYTDYIGETAQPEVITRYYFGGAYETDGTTWKKYYSFGGATLMRDADGFKYFLSDHLGSTSVVLSPDGDDPDTEMDVEQQRYLPFGEVRTDIATPPYRVTSTDFTYTGQRNLEGTGLMDYKARFYSPSLGRFIQPDSMIPSVANPQGLNRFSYVINNPLQYTDPTGHKWDDCSKIDDDVKCKRKMQRVNKIKDRWKAQEKWAKKQEAKQRAAQAAFAQFQGMAGQYMAQSAAYSASTTSSGVGKGVYRPLPLQGGSSTGGDADVGYEIRYDVGVVLVHYYGQHDVINLNEISTNSVEYQALMAFEANANDRVSSINNVSSAQSSFVGNSLLAIGGAALAGVSLASTPVTGPLGGLGIIIGVGVAIGAAINVYNSGMAWGTAAEAYQTAEANVAADWSVISASP